MELQGTQKPKVLLVLTEKVNHLTLNNFHFDMNCSQTASAILWYEKCTLYPLLRKDEG